MSDLLARLRETLGDPHADVFELLNDCKQEADAEGRSWCPLDFVDESMPPGRASAEAWAGWLARHCGLQPGELVEFHWQARRGRIEMTVQADGGWTLSGPLPAGANHLVAYLEDDAWGEPSLLGDGLQDLAQQLLRLGPPAEAFPQTVEVDCWELNSGDWRYALVRRHCAGYGFERVTAL